MKTKSALFSILIIALVASCKKEKTPSPATTSTPPITTTTNDTVGKHKLYYTIALAEIHTSPTNYHQDTATIRMYINGKNVPLLYPHYDYSPTYGYDLVGLGNFNYGAVNALEIAKPIWVKAGDTLTVILQHLEYKSGNSYLGNYNGINLYSAPNLSSGILPKQTFIYDNSDAATYNDYNQLTDTNLGVGSEGGSPTPIIYLGGSYTFKLIIP